MFRGEEAETICVCKEGFSGDPDSQRGCNEQTDKSTVRPKEGCIVKNETYAVGEEWDDGCEYKCSCSKKLEILCQVSGSFARRLIHWPLPRRSAVGTPNIRKAGIPRFLQLEYFSSNFGLSKSLVNEALARIFQRLGSFNWVELST